MERTDHLAIPAINTTWTVPTLSRFLKGIRFSWRYASLLQSEGVQCIGRVSQYVCYYIDHACAHYYHYSVGCSKDYIEIYDGTDLVSNKKVISSDFQQAGLQTPEGCICDNRGYTLVINMHTDVATLYLHTNGSGFRSRGLYATFTAVGKCSIIIVRACSTVTAWVPLSLSLTVYRYK